MLSFLRWERQQNDFFKSISSSHITLSFLFIWNENDKYVHALPNFLENHTRIQTKNRFSDQNGAKPIPFGAAHAYITEYPLWLFLDKITWEDQKFKENGPHHWLHFSLLISFLCLWFVSRGELIAKGEAAFINIVEFKTKVVCFFLFL